MDLNNREKADLEKLIHFQKEIKRQFQTIQDQILQLCLTFQGLETNIAEYNNLLDTYFSNTLEDVQLDLRALDFDLHTTRVERDEYRNKLEGK